MMRVLPAIVFAASWPAPVLASAQSPNYVQQPNQGYAQSPSYAPNQQAPYQQAPYQQAPYSRTSRYGTPANTQPQQAPMQQMPMQSQRMQRASVPMEGRYTTADMARSACGGDPVVWANTSTKVYHMQDSSFFGKNEARRLHVRAQCRRGWLSRQQGRLSERQ